MKWKTILKDSARAAREGECPNCGGKIRQYYDDPNDDLVSRCEKGVANKFQGRFANCYAEEGE